MRARVRSGGARRASRGSSRGAALVEFALCFPFLLLLFSAAIEYGFMIYDAMELQDAAREGARWAAKGEDDTQTQNRVGTYFPLRNISNPSVTIETFTANGTSIGKNPGGPANSRVPGATIKVTVSCQVQWLTPIQYIFGGTPYGLSSSASYRVENL